MSARGPEQGSYEGVAAINGRVYAHAVLERDDGLQLSAQWCLRLNW